MAVAGATLLYGLVVTAVGRFEDISEFAFATLRVKIERRIEQADAILAQLREIAADISSAHLETLIASHFVAGTPFARKLAQHQSLMALLERAGVSAERRQQVEERWRLGVQMVIIVAMRGAAERVVEGNSERRLALHREIDAANDWREWTVATPETLRTIIERHSAMSADVEEWLAELQRYRAGQDLQRAHEFR